ncbi:hypothetical protein TNCT_685571 [Trichonephila clavata]|uniref:Uncharacterized protein n=1 Tax=Trichonephila clavata TaxID=2740835 RepID=A0A8X6FDW8_TRICU|nr:hypothetical protein TNCT_685571 [Trichonephila clavata]
MTDLSKSCPTPHTYSANSHLKSETLRVARPSYLTRLHDHFIPLRLGVYLLHKLFVRSIRSAQQAHERLFTSKQLLLSEIFEPLFQFGAGLNSWSLF